jgi:ArsR family transcriptional regulator
MAETDMHEQRSKEDLKFEPGAFAEEAEILRVLGHPIRLQIVVGLLGNSCCVKDIWGCLGLPQATVSQHLSALRAKGIVSGKREGNSITYEVVNPFVRGLVAFLQQKAS